MSQAIKTVSEKSKNTVRNASLRICVMCAFSLQVSCGPFSLNWGSAMSALTEEQKARIASNRQKAIEIRAQREAENREVSASTGLPNVKKPKVEVIDQAPGMSKQFTFGTVQPSSGSKTEIRINFELVSPMECRVL